ncbi:MAG: hypothetical protein A2Y42_04380 [Omnitrophica WOR_2 bacterium GWB2_45_9]|nr:MAG: hypothetical protein A2Y42_04380 [Omnitrophica WOR_2 bacterium GWB2_45_9]
MRNKALSAVWLVVFIGLITIAASQGYAANKKGDTVKAKAVSAEEEANQAEQARIKAQEEKMSARRESEKKANEALAQKEWQIEVTEIGVKKMKPEIDVLTFAEGKVISKNYSAKGYSPTNITLTVQDSGTIVWETMQTNPEHGTVFWRGELSNGLISGAVSLQPKKGDNKDYYFAAVRPQEEAGSVKIEAQKTESKEAGAVEPRPKKAKKEPKKKK